MISFDSHWDRACFHKRMLFDKFNFDKGISYKSVNYEIPKTFEKQFLKKIGFWEKWSKWKIYMVVDLDIDR